MSQGLGPPLADIDHLATRGGQRPLLPIAVTGADLPPIVEKQGFHLLGKDIAQRGARRLLLAPPIWIEPLLIERIELDLGDGIVPLMPSTHLLPAIRHRVLLRFWVAGYKEVAWRGNARAKEKTALWSQMFPHARQQPFLVRSCHKVLK